MNTVVVCTPCYGGVVTGEHALSLVGLQELARESQEAQIFRGFSRVPFALRIVHLYNESLMPRARATLVARFLEIQDATHLLFIDADLAFPAYQVERMLEFNKDFVAGLYPAKILNWDRLNGPGLPIDTRLLEYVGEFCVGEEFKTEKNFATGTKAGGGFQLIKREVFLEMFKKYDHLQFNHIDTYSDNTSEYFYDLFSPMIDDSGCYLSEDFAFCERWRHMGGEIWLDLDSNITHKGTYDFRGNTGDRFLEKRK